MRQAKRSANQEMKLKGINYDVGIEFNELYHSRPLFDIEVIKKELKIIKTDLHCNAIRISGTEIERLIKTSDEALKLGFQVWLSPHLHDKDQQQTSDYIVNCAKEAEVLRKKQNNIVFILGCELTFFMDGILKGNNVLERLGNPISLLWQLKILGSHNKPLNAFLKRLNDEVRQVFNGQVTYSAAPIEAVDWSLFDFVSLDYYRQKQNRNNYIERLQKHFKHNKPVVITEFGCCTYKGAENKGAWGWMIVDTQKEPKQLKGNYVRDEHIQASELDEMLHLLGSSNIKGAFVFTFVSPALTTDKNPKFDLDMASYSIVKSYKTKKGKTYPDMNWEPKESFNVVAGFFNDSKKQRQQNLINNIRRNL